MFLICISIFNIGSLKAQYPIYNQEPFSTNWSQVNTAKFRVIYPEGNDSLAIGLVRKLQTYYNPVSASLNAYPEKLSLILRSNTTIPNGFVTLAPRRSEFFTMPPQDYNFAGTNHWLDLLAVHEYRHVVQFEKANTGFNKLLYTVFGEEALAGMSYIAVPQWFWEGDAVVMETALTPSGRGRIPEFNMVFRTNLLERGAFNYNKQYLRSFKDFVPNHYVFGYFMVSHVRRNYENNFWDDILEEAFSKPFIPFTFSRAMKKFTGKNVVKNYWGMMQEMDSLWTKELDEKSITTATLITPLEEKVYTNYMYPQVLDNGDVIAFKEGLGDLHQLVRLTPSGELKQEFITGLFADAGMLSAKSERVAWVEYKPDLRWGARTLNQIKVYNLTTGKIKTVTEPSRYSAAALSPDAQRIATVHTSNKNEFFLVILDAETGKEVRRFPNPQNDFISMPRWSEDGKYIVALKTTDAGRSVIQVAIEGGNVKELIPPSAQNVGHPIQYKNFLLYNLAHDGIDNIFALDITTGQHYQVTSRKFGAFNPTMNQNGDSLYFNDYQVNGMEIAKMPFRPDKWKQRNKLSSNDSPAQFIQPIVQQEKKLSEGGEALSDSYTIGSYRPFRHMFNIHSWGVLLTESDNFYALGVKSRDLLGTTAFSVGYAYNPFENAGHGYGRVSYQGLFPIVDLEVKAGNRRVEESVRRDDVVVNQDLEWDEKSASVGLRMPFNFTNSKYFRRSTISTKYELTQVDNYSLSERKITQQADGLLQSISYGAQYSRLLKMAKRDINSRWGQYFDVRFEHTPLGGDYDGGIFHAQTILYNPGLFKHHSFFLKGSYQHQDFNTLYRFGSSMIYPRGYSYISLEDFYFASANYALPLFYPDWSIGPFLYFQRLKANLFYDRGWGSHPELVDAFDFESTGIELSVDFNFMRFLPLLNLGIRYTYLPDQNSFETQLIIGSLGF